MGYVFIYFCLLLTSHKKKREKEKRECDAKVDVTRDDVLCQISVASELETAESIIWPNKRVSVNVYYRVWPYEIVQWIRIDINQWSHKFCL